MRTVIAATALAAALGLAACGGTGATDGVGGQSAETVSSEPETSAPETADEPDMPAEAATPTISLSAVKIKSCKVGEYGVEVTGTVTNPAAVVSDMSATIEITNGAGDRIDEAGILESAVKPGQKVKYEAVGLEDPKDLGTKKVKCSVLSVDVYPSS